MILHIESYSGENEHQRRRVLLLRTGTPTYRGCAAGPSGYDVCTPLQTAEKSVSFLRLGGNSIYPNYSA
jgi:hypothetical protein